ncbi:hypothetical protein ATSB10_21780 [Dyella thiooxydans]|uniref:Uncharacterized protein n=1 Tax=Dyella thiooxydans TaxID=445710 RepID=A0A160N2U4_9GAMM|nr:hypothetical protein ATSB10_21780 [Dyella thiooxydans]
MFPPQNRSSGMTAVQGGRCGGLMPRTLLAAICRAAPTA